jgi:hypothetical protein
MKWFRHSGGADVPSRYNIAPTQVVAVVLQDDGRRMLQPM